MIKLIKYTLKSVLEYFELLFNFQIEDFRLYRYYKGGTWYKHEMSGELPGCYGSFWADYGKLNRYTNVVKKEIYKN